MFWKVTHKIPSLKFRAVGLDTEPLGGVQFPGLIHA